MLAYKTCLLVITCGFTQCPQYAALSTLVKSTSHCHHFVAGKSSCNQTVLRSPSVLLQAAPLFTQYVSIFFTVQFLRASSLVSLNARIYCLLSIITVIQTGCLIAAVTRCTDLKYSVILSVLDPRKFEYLKDYSLDFEHAYMTTYLAS